MCRKICLWYIQQTFTDALWRLDKYQIQIQLHIALYIEGIVSIIQENVCVQHDYCVLLFILLHTFSDITDST